MPNDLQNEIANLLISSVDHSTGTITLDWAEEPPHLWGAEMMRAEMEANIIANARFSSAFTNVVCTPATDTNGFFIQGIEIWDMNY